MILPPSFTKDGFQPLAKIRPRMKLKNGRLLKPLMIGTEGATNTGKTEFILSCPGPGILIVVDRAIDGPLDNTQPPASRNSDNFAGITIHIPTNLTATQEIYVEYYKKIRDTFYKALANPDAVTVALDGDSDFWELQRLAAFGKLANVWPQTKYGDVYAAKRGMINRAWDSGKIIIGTNKIRDEYVETYDAQGNVVMEDGQPKKVKSGNLVRQGFPDTDYLWQMQIRHLYKPPGINKITKKPTPAKWGLQILKCKANPRVQGLELWDSDCCFRGLVETAYPNIDPKEWGL